MNIISRKFESGKNQSEVVASYNIGLSAVCAVKKQERPGTIVMASGESVKNHSKQQTLKEPKFSTFGKGV